MTCTCSPEVVYTRTAWSKQSVTYTSSSGLTHRWCGVRSLSPPMLRTYRPYQSRTRTTPCCRLSPEWCARPDRRGPASRSPYPRRLPRSPSESSPLPLRTGNRRFRVSAPRLSPLRRVALLALSRPVGPRRQHASRVTRTWKSCAGYRRPVYRLGTPMRWTPGTHISAPSGKSKGIAMSILRKARNPS